MAEISKELRKKMLKRKKEIKDSGGQKGLLFIKANETIRVRPLPVGPDNEPGMEMIQYYLGGDLKGVISPKSVGEPCALFEKYEALKAKGNEDDAGILEKLKPKKKYVIPVVKKVSKTDKSVDDKTGVRLLVITAGVYQQLIDLFMDPEQGDFTDPSEGYDVKISRTGTGKTDTEYSVIPCKPSSMPEKYHKVQDVEALLRKVVPTYEETKAYVSQILPEKKKKKKKVRD